MSRPKKTKATRSGLEDTILTELRKEAVGFTYEPCKIKYRPKDCTYTPDLILENGIYVEIKGYFTASDRAKHLLVQAQHPSVDLRFVFQRPYQRLHKASKTTYASWCEAHGFKWTGLSELQVLYDWAKEGKSG
jgi:hypothetical protein